MWKFIARGIRDTLERRTSYRTNVCSQSSQKSDLKSEAKICLVDNEKFLAPSFSAFINGFCASAKARGAKDEKEEFKWHAKHSWTEAVGWVRFDCNDYIAHVGYM